MIVNATVKIVHIFQISEDAQTGSTVSVVSADDKDFGDNILTYTITGGKMS